MSYWRIFFRIAHVYDTLQCGKEELLFLGCKGFTRLLVVLKLFNLKVKSGWTDKSFTKLFELLKDMLSEGNTLFNRNYETKKIFVQWILTMSKIHVCHNDFIINKKEYEKLNEFSRCGESHYKLKDNNVDVGDCK